MNAKKILVFAVMLTMAFIACDNGTTGGGGGSSGSGTRDAKTYTGTTDGITYTLKIEDGGARAALTPTKGDKYTLTQTANTKKSTGTVTKVVGGVLTLAPKEDPDDEFTTTVSGNGISAMSGTITWDDGTANIAPDTLTPSTGGASGTSGGLVSVANTNGQLTINGLSQYNGQWAYALALPILNEDDELILFAAASVTTSAVTLAKISGGSITLKVWKLTEVDENSSKLESYSGNDNDLGMVVVIASKATITSTEADQVTSGGSITYFPDWLKGGGMSFSGVDFSNGKATCTPSMLFDAKDLPNYPGSSGLPGSGLPGGGYSSDSGEGWPSSTILSSYGVSGLTQPSGSDFEWSAIKYGSLDMLTIEFTTTNDTATSSSLKSYFSNGWTKFTEATTSDGTVIQWTKSPWKATYEYYGDGDAELIILKS